MLLQRWPENIQGPVFQMVEQRLLSRYEPAERVKNTCTSFPERCACCTSVSVLKGLGEKKEFCTPLCSFQFSFHSKQCLSS